MVVVAGVFLDALGDECVWFLKSCFESLLWDDKYKTIIRMN